MSRTSCGGPLIGRISDAERRPSTIFLCSEMNKSTMLFVDSPISCSSTRRLPVVVFEGNFKVEVETEGEGESDKEEDDDEEKEKEEDELTQKRLSMTFSRIEGRS